LLLIIAVPLWHEYTQGDTLFQQRRAALETLLRVERPQEPWVKATLVYRDLEERQLASQELRSRINLYSTILMALVTIVLVWATLRYVELTHELVESSKAQLEHSLAREEASRRQEVRNLELLCRRLAAAIAALPKTTDKMTERVMREAAIWDGQDLHDLESLATALDSTEGAHAIQTVNNLRWVGERVHMVKTTPPIQGVRWDKFPWPEWAQKLTEAEENLRALITACEAYALPTASRTT
jgi:hypothetical protein